MMKVFAAGVLSGILLLGCASGTTKSIKAHHQVKNQISLGLSKSQVLAILAPTQSELSANQSKAPEVFKHEGKVREIHFARSGLFNDGLVTDDEFTPYIFDDNILVGIGWTAIGGPKTQAQVRNNQNRYGLFLSNRRFLFHGFF